MSFKNLDLSKIKISDTKAEAPVEYKGNVQVNIGVTDHVLDRFAERHMNGLKYDLTQIRQYVSNLIHEKGIEGFNDRERNQYYIAVYGIGLFIITEGNIATTFIGQSNLSRYHLDLFRKLLKKGRVN